MTREEKQKAIDALKISAPVMPVTQEEFMDYVQTLNKIMDWLEQEPKTGHWITQWNPAHQKEYYYCPECREEYSYDGETGIKMNDYNYCPNCGAKMVEIQERSDKE